MAKTIRKRARKSRTPEGSVMREIAQCLGNHRILAYRMNVGAHEAKDAHGKARLIRYGTVGMADWIAFPIAPINVGDCVGSATRALWIEAKAAKGKQTPSQEAFEKIVTDNGCWYVVVRSYEELEAYLRSKGVVR
jgi:hypothetical protein